MIDRRAWPALLTLSLALSFGCAAGQDDQGTTGDGGALESDAHGADAGTSDSRESVDFGPGADTGVSVTPSDGAPDTEHAGDTSPPFDSGVDPFDSGSPPPFDSGTPPPFDTGTPPPFDTGAPPPFDTGALPPFDSGTPPPFDTGTPPPFDSGVFELDTGTPPPFDSGVFELDTGTASPDSTSKFPDVSPF